MLVREPSLDGPRFSFLELIKLVREVKMVIVFDEIWCFVRLFAFLTTFWHFSIKHVLISFLERIELVRKVERLHDSNGDCSAK